MNGHLPVFKNSIYIGFVAKKVWQLNSSLESRLFHILQNGQDGNDFMLGGDGNDEMNGGDGNDEMEGGYGGDSFNCGGGSSNDKISDFSGKEGDTKSEDCEAF